MRRNPGCVLLAAALALFGSGCPPSAPECASHAVCLARHGPGWYCHPESLTCVLLDPCAAACAGRECGLVDGCACGTCPAGQFCNDQGQCELCQPDCTDKECGPDGCGGSCGTCPGPKVCYAPGVCVWVDVPNCGSRVCGMAPNGMGTCGPLGGECPAGLSCEPMTGQCVCLPDCGQRVCGPAPNGCGICGTCLAPEVCDTHFGLCYIPAVAGRGDPCAFGQVNAAAGDCQPGLECLGMNPDPATMPCTQAENCAGFLPAIWNPDCAGGGCGVSFCASECTDGACPDGYDPATVSGTCYCVPGGGPDGCDGPGCPCPFTGGVNAAADNCGSSMDCLGIPPDPEARPCEQDADCLEYHPLNWNPDCVNGGCGASFCSAPCNNGACPAGFDPQTISGTCYCIPAEDEGG